MNSTEHLIQWENDKIARLWDYYSRNSRYRDGYFSNVFGDRILRQSGLSLTKSLEVLDFGCGPGFIFDHLQRLKANWRYTAIDFSEESIKAIDSRAYGNPRFRGAYHVNQLPTPLDDGAFDITLLIEVIEHLKDEDLSSTLHEVSRLTKRNGVLLITTPNAEDLSKSTTFCPECGAVFHEWQHVRSWNIASLTNHLNHHGFTLSKGKPLNFAALSPLRRLLSVAVKKLQGKPVNPHLMAVFTKN